MTPMQDLAMEVLVARRRLGEAIWTFKSMHTKTLRELDEQDLVFVMRGVTEGTVRAGLTEEGARRFMSDDYVPPILARDDLAVRLAHAVLEEDERRRQALAAQHGELMGA